MQIECGHKCACEDWFIHVREREHVCVCVCVCVYLYIYIYVRVCFHVCMQVCGCAPSFMVGALARISLLAVRDGDGAVASLVVALAADARTS